MARRRRSGIRKRCVRELGAVGVPGVLELGFGDEGSKVSGWRGCGDLVAVSLAFLWFTA